MLGPPSVLENAVLILGPGTWPLSGELRSKMGPSFRVWQGQTFWPACAQGRVTGALQAGAPLGLIKLGQAGALTLVLQAGGVVFVPLVPAEASPLS